MKANNMSSRFFFLKKIVYNMLFILEREKKSKASVQTWPFKPRSTEPIFLVRCLAYFYVLFFNFD